MLEIRGVTKVYETGGLSHTALDKVSLNFRANEFVAILGPSGSGKTTLLNIIGGLDHYTAGDLKVNEVSTKKFRDKDWDAYRNHRIGFVFQSYNLIPHQTVLANVKLALTLSGISKREATRRAKRALEEVGLKDHINKRPSQLSGGQMQRVAIARALVNDPEILLADEPTGALDSDTSVQIMNLLKEIAEKKLVIMVTHNPELAEEYATRIITLKDGKITSDSDPYDGKVNTRLRGSDAAEKGKKTKMSFLTALSLSLNNLLTKKGRTVLVAFAGSIGIIGIALILAVSTGFQAYIDSIEQDTLTQYPLAIQRESADITGVLLGAFGGGKESDEEGKVLEDAMLGSVLGNVTKNDLKSFRAYVDNHYDEIRDDVRLIENEYNIDPLIYTVDAAEKLAKVNPSAVFSSLMGGSALMSSYSSMTSAYEQYALENITEDTEVLAGRYPEKYNEMVIFLANPGSISDYLTYSLGLHDTAELSEVLTKVMTGEEAEFSHENLTLSYEELMDVDLRLIYPADTYRYNSIYNIYEDMSGDAGYMQGLYEKAEKLEIVGVVTAKSGTLSAGSGVFYLPSLTEHIIEVSREKEIVRKQLESPEVDVFSNVRFGEEKTESLEFSDLVSVDTSKIQKAFSFNLDTTKLEEEAITAAEKIAREVAEEVSLELLKDQDVFEEKFEEVAGEIVAEIQEYIESEDFEPEEMGEKIQDIIENVIAETDFSDISEILNGLDISGMIAGKFSGMMDKMIASIGGSFRVDEKMLMSAFSMKLSEEELARMMSAMYSKEEVSFSGNLAKLGYQALDDPSHISFYFNSFDGKTRFMEFIDKYNEMMRGYHQDNKVIEYTDTTGVLMSSVKTIVDAVSYVLIAFVSISLIVSSIMIGIITYISVYERTKEIGILRAIGASKRNISSIFNAETFIVGLLSGLFGIGISYLLIPIINAVLHHFTGDIPLSAQLAPGSAVVLIVISVILTLIGGLIPAKTASKRDPVEALRSE